MKSDSNDRYANLDFGDLRLAWLETFVCVARLRNRSAVGKELGISQGAVTKHIQSLEGWSRKVLVHADSVPATLTDDGVELLEVAQLIIETLADVRMSGVAAKSLSHGPVSGDGLKMPDVEYKVGSSAAHLRVPPSVPTGSVSAKRTDDGVREMTQFLLQALSEEHMNEPVSQIAEREPVSAKDLKVPVSAPKAVSSTAHLKVPPMPAKSHKG